MNYADWDNPLIQSGRLYEVLRKYDMPFLVMEPVKGGSLASAGKEIEAEMKRVHPDASIASWALRFAASLPGVATVLSGMSNEEQMEDNIKTFRNFVPLNEEEKSSDRQSTGSAEKESGGSMYRLSLLLRRMSDGNRDSGCVQGIEYHPPVWRRRPREKLL